VCTGFWWGDLKEREYLGNPSIVGRIVIKMDMREVGWGHGLDWSGQDSNRWRALVNAVMNLRFP
jgi:hypothetical protein